MKMSQLILIEMKILKISNILEMTKEKYFKYMKTLHLSSLS